MNMAVEAVSDVAEGMAEALTSAAGAVTSSVADATSALASVASAMGSASTVALARAPAAAAPAQPSEASRLPDGWLELISEDGRFYYYHRETRQAQWKMPTSSSPPTPAKAPHSNPQALVASIASASPKVRSMNLPSQGQSFGRLPHVTVPPQRPQTRPQRILPPVVPPVAQRLPQSGVHDARSAMSSKTYSGTRASPPRNPKDDY